VTAPTPHEQVTAQLAALGDTEQAVAATLSAGGYRGCPGRAGHCPICDYLTATVRNAWNVFVCQKHVAFGGGRFVATPPPVAAFIHAFDRGQYPGLVGVPAHHRSGEAGRLARPLTADLAELVVADLAADGILVAVHPGQVVGIDALVPLTTLQEVQALTAFRAVTDSRLAWHPAVTR
jgi:hypothetical protein